MGVNGADLVGYEGGVVEDASAVEVVDGHVLRRPAEAGDDGEALGGVESILHVQAGDGTAQGVLLLLALRVGAHRAFEQVESRRRPPIRFRRPSRYRYRRS